MSKHDKSKMVEESFRVRSNPKLNRFIFSRPKITLKERLERINRMFTSDISGTEGLREGKKQRALTRIARATTIEEPRQGFFARGARASSRNVR